MLTLYGIKSCDTVKKARTWLEDHGIEYQFHDYKTAGIDRATLEHWCKQLDWQVLLNRAGTTFKKLSDADKENIDQSKAITLMLAHSSIIKRPVLVNDAQLLIGFKPDLYATQLRSE